MKEKINILNREIEVIFLKPRGNFIHQKHNIRILKFTRWAPQKDANDKDRFSNLKLNKQKLSNHMNKEKN